MNLLLNGLSSTVFVNKRTLQVFLELWISSVRFMPLQWEKNHHAALLLATPISRFIRSCRSFGRKHEVGAAKRQTQNREDLDRIAQVSAGEQCRYRWGAVMHRTDTNRKSSGQLGRPYFQPQIGVFHAQTTLGQWGALCLRRLLFNLGHPSIF